MLLSAFRVKKWGCKSNKALWRRKRNNGLKPDRHRRIYFLIKERAKWLRCGRRFQIDSDPATSLIKDAMRSHIYHLFVSLQSPFTLKHWHSHRLQGTAGCEYHTVGVTNYHLPAPAPQRQSLPPSMPRHGSTASSRPEQGCPSCPPWTLGGRLFPAVSAKKEAGGMAGEGLGGWNLIPQTQRALVKRVPLHTRMLSGGTLPSSTHLKPR